MSPAARAFFSLLILGLSTACMELSCMDQYNPHPYWQQWEQERHVANNLPPKLTTSGKIPLKEEAHDLTAIANKKYAMFCASCHGAQGDGNTPMAQTLKPPPRSFTNKDWQLKVSDQHIATVIQKGGPAVGLSAAMAPWGGVLSTQEIQAMVKKIRSFGN